MTTFKELRLLVRFGIALFLFCYVGFSVFTSRDFVKKYYKNDVLPILSMYDLGYDNSFTNASDLKQLLMNNEFVGSYYYLSISTNYDEDNLHLMLEIYDLKSDEETHDYFEDIVEQKYTSFKKSQANCLGYNCKFPTISFDVAVDNMFLLDSDLWESEKAYSVYDIHNQKPGDKFVNTIFVLKECKIIVLQIDDGIYLTEENIKVLINAFDKSSEYIKEMKGSNT